MNENEKPPASRLPVNVLVSRERRLCRKCRKVLKPGIAIQQTLVGCADFIGGEVITLSPGGPGKLISCLKCPKCGHSITC